MASSDKNIFLRMLQDLPTWGSRRMVLITGTPTTRDICKLIDTIRIGPDDPDEMSDGELADWWADAALRLATASRVALCADLPASISRRSTHD